MGIRTEKKGKLYHGYIVLAGSFLILMIVNGANYCFGVFLKPVIAEFGWSRAETAAAFSLYYAFWAVFSIFAGRMSDRFAPRLVITVSGILVGCSYLLITQITTVWQLYLLYGVLLSIGMAGIYVTLFSTVARWFIKRMGLASGIISAGIGIGVIIMPPLASFLISSYNWRISFMVVGLITLTVPIIAQFLKRGPVPSEKEIKEITLEQERQRDPVKEGLTLREALRTRQLWLISATFFILGMCLQIIMVHIVAYATDIGIAANIAATVLSVIGIVSIFSKIGIGGAVDRLRVRNIYIVEILLMSVAFLILLLFGGMAGLYVFAVVFAISYGGFVAAQSPTIAEYFGLKAHGAIFGIAQCVAGIGCAIGPYLTGLIFDAMGSYNLAFIGCAVMCAAGVILPIMLKPAR